jgi:hypothetical protein
LTLRKGWDKEEGISREGDRGGQGEDGAEKERGKERGKEHIVRGARAGAHACPVCGSAHGVVPTHTHLSSLSLPPPPPPSPVGRLRSAAPLAPAAHSTRTVPRRSLGAGAAQSNSLIQSLGGGIFFHSLRLFPSPRKRQTCEHFRLRAPRTQARRAATA